MGGYVGPEDDNHDDIAEGELSPNPGEWDAHVQPPRMAGIFLPMHFTKFTLVLTCGEIERKELRAFLLLEY